MNSQILQDIVVLVGAIQATQAVLANATRVSHRWKAASLHILYACPFITGRTQVFEFQRTIGSSTDLAQLVQQPTLMFLSTTVFPIPSSRIRHWWKSPLSITAEESLENWTRALGACPSLTGVSYFSRQREVSYEFPSVCLDTQCVPRSFTMAGCNLESFYFPLGSIFTNVQTLSLIGYGLDGVLPQMPLLRFLRFAKLRLSGNYLGPIFSRNDISALEATELHDNGAGIVDAVMDHLSRQQLPTRLLLVGHHERAALNRVLSGGHTCIVHLTVPSLGFVACSRGAVRLPSRLKTLAVLRFLPEDSSDLLALADCLENSARIALTELRITGVLKSSGVEEADTISLGRIKQWCDAWHIRLFLEEDDSECVAVKRVPNG